MTERNNTLYKKLRDEVGKCELCGSKRNLEVHHLVPISCGGDNEENNLIVVCGACHSRLTPRSVLSRLGIKRNMESNIAYNAMYRMQKYFYGTLLEMCDDCHHGVDQFDVMDVFDKCIEKVRNEIGNKNIPHNVNERTLPDEREQIEVLIDERPVPADARKEDAGGSGGQDPGSAGCAGVQLSLLV